MATPHSFAGFGRFLAVLAVIAAVLIGVLLVFLNLPARSGAANASGPLPTPSFASAPVAPTPTPTAKQLAAEKVNLREHLRATFERYMQAANSHLNFIKVKLKSKGGKNGDALFAVHTYFTQYTFDIGPTAKEVSDWIDAYRTELNQAGITRVGVASRDNWSGSTWFDLAK